MTEDQAKARCDELTAEHPDRHTHRWVPSERGDEWVVVKIGLPPAGEGGTAETRADEKPPTPDDPRTPPWINPPGAGFS